VSLFASRTCVTFIDYFPTSEPDCRDMSNMVPSDIVGNCKKAFETGEKLGIPRVIEPADMSLLAVPDKLAVMTYLYQLHAHFTGRQLEVDRIGKWKRERE